MTNTSVLPKLVLWDWNGSVFDDLDISIKSVNLLLSDYNKPPIDRQQYHSYVDTPIVKFYQHLFDLEKTPFSIIGDQFHKHYGILSKEAGITPGVMETIKELYDLNVAQYIVSASHENVVIPLCKELGVFGYMTDIIAACDYVASSKIQRTIDYFNGVNLKLCDCLVVGDTLHDLEMAKALDARCILLSTGHDGKLKLEKSGGFVVDTISLQTIQNLYQGKTTV